jgi:DNA polymerase-3 subunit alpha
MFAAIDAAMSYAQKAHHQRTVGQHGLFLGGPSVAAHEPVSHALPEADDWTEEQQLAGEYSTLGFYISGHPLDKYAGRLKELGAAEIGSYESWRHGEELVVAGIIVQSRPMRSKKGSRWMIITLQDQTGVMEALVFPEAFQKLEPILKPATPLLLKGKVAVEDAGTRLMVSEGKLLEQVAEKKPKLLRVRVELGTISTGTLDQLKEIFVRRPGRCRVEFEIVAPDGVEATLETDGGVNADGELVAEVRAICGPNAVALQ